MTTTIKVKYVPGWNGRTTVIRAIRLLPPRVVESFKRSTTSSFVLARPLSRSEGRHSKCNLPR